MHKSILETYRKIGTILAEALDPKGWRTWPLDPKDPKKGTLSAQNIWAQERPKEDPALTNWGKGHAGKPYATRRTRVTTPAKKFGLKKGTITNHTTATNFETERDPQNGWTRSTAQVKSKGPMAIKRNTSVKGKIKNDDGTTQQVNVKNFPTKHSNRK
tara:strand:- start:592 stop:1065 length:474 start_codon:yes stop_codon:yes gene_type:complete